MLPWNRAIYHTNGSLMREKAGNLIWPPNSNIQFQHPIPTCGRPNSTHLRLFEAIERSPGPITASELAAQTGSEHLLVGEPFTEDLPSSTLLTRAIYFSAPPPRHHRPRARRGSRLGDIPCPSRNAHHGLAHDPRRASALVRLKFSHSWSRTCFSFAIACLLKRDINNIFLLSVAGTKASPPSSISPPT